MRYTYNDIGTLVRRVKQNDSQAFTVLYERTYQKIYFLSLSILKNEQDAQDVVQESYIRLLDSIHTLEDESLFIAWFHRITYHACVRMLEKRKEIPTDHLMIADTPDYDISHDPFTALVQNEQKKLLAKAVQKLEPDLRTTVLLKYFENMKISDIALVMNCPVGTVKSRLRVAKKQLLTSMRKDGSLAMFVAMISMVPLRGIYHEAAQEVGMSSQAAFGILNNTMAHNSMAAPLAFTSTGSAAVGTGLILGAHTAGVAVSISAACVAAAAVTGLVLYASPIKQVITPSSYSAFTASIVVETEGSLPVTELYAVAPDNKRIESRHRTDGLFEIQVPENGDYAVCAVTKGGRVTEETVSIGSIDNTAPKIQSNTVEGKLLRVVFTDTQSGPDLTTTYGELPDGTQIAPISIDTAEQSALFSLTGEDFVFYISDAVGNTARHEVTVTKVLKQVP